MFSIFFFFNDTATTEIYTLSLHDALPISPMHAGMSYRRLEELGGIQWPCPDEDHPGTTFLHARLWESGEAQGPKADRKSTRLNSSHLVISYAVFCLKKKKRANLVAILLQR